MNRFKLVALLICNCITYSAIGQEDAEDWLQNGRPECVQDADSDGVTPRPGFRKIGSQATAPLKSVGVQHVPVVLVAFADKAFSVSDTAEGVNAYYQKYCNGTMDGIIYTGHGSHGSIRDYFVEQSDSAFFPEFTVIGPVTLDGECNYYGQNSYEYEYNDAGEIVSKRLIARDVNYRQFVSEALTKATALNVNWDVFDNDGNGSIDMVFFIYAGLGESNTQDRYPNLIWPKESTAATTINGRLFATSAITCEQRPVKWNDERTEVVSTKADGVGVFIHELSHALGLPDFYDTRGKAFGMDLWSVMDYGEYGGNGYNPGNYTAYERDFMGWRPLQVLDSPCVLTIPCFADGGYGYKIVNDANEDEYYVLENRQAKGWDDAIGKVGHGLQVTHVDYINNRWTANSVNTDPAHQCMTIIAANNTYKGTTTATSSKEWQASLRGNLYPGDTYNYSLTDESTPAAVVYAGELMHKPIRQIVENADNTVTICYRTNGKLDTPVMREAENIQMDQFDAGWESVENATHYEYELYKEQERVDGNTTSELTVHFDNLQSGCNYRYRVRALADSPEDYIESEWSDFANLSTLTDYVDAVWQKENWVDVYTTSGIRLIRCRVKDVWGTSLRRGVYIIRYANGAIKRVLVD